MRTIEISFKDSELLEIANSNNYKEKIDEILSREFVRDGVMSEIVNQARQLKQYLVVDNQ